MWFFYIINTGIIGSTSVPIYKTFLAKTQELRNTSTNAKYEKFAINPREISTKWSHASQCKLISQNYLEE